MIWYKSNDTRDTFSLFYIHRRHLKYVHLTTNCYNNELYTEHRYRINIWSTKSSRLWFSTAVHSI